MRMLPCVAGAGTTPISKTATIKLAAGDTAILIEVGEYDVLSLAPVNSQPGVEDRGLRRLGAAAALPASKADLSEH